MLKGSWLRIFNREADGGDGTWCAVFIDWYDGGVVLVCNVCIGVIAVVPLYPNIVGSVAFCGDEGVLPGVGPSAVIFGTVIGLDS